jgi:hypothetical protein
MSVHSYVKLHPSGMHESAGNCAGCRLPDDIGGTAYQITALKQAALNRQMGLFVPTTWWLPAGMTPAFLIERITGSDFQLPQSQP